MADDDLGVCVPVNRRQAKITYHDDLLAYTKLSDEVQDKIQIHIMDRL